jgi:ABC-type transporter Mla subunit MlaD
MSSYTRNEVVSGLFVVGAAVVFALFAFRVGRLDFGEWLGKRGAACIAWFDDVKTLEQGAKVVVAGHRVGTVREVRLTERPVDRVQLERLIAEAPGITEGLAAGMSRMRLAVVFEIEDESVRFDPESARVSLAQDGFLGRHHLSFYPGHWSPEAPPAPPPSGAQTEIATAETAGIDQLISAVNPAVRRIDALLASLQEEVLDQEGVRAARAALGDLSTALREIATLLDSSAPEGMHALVLNPLRDLLVNANDSLDQVDERLIAPAEAVLKGAPPLLDEARAAARDLGAMLAENRPHVRSVVAQLDAATRDLEAQLASIESNLSALLRSTRGLVDETSPDLAETARRLRRAMWQAEMAARKIRANPAFLLFGDSEQDWEEGARDPAGTWRSGRAEAYRQRDEGEK